MWPNLFVDIQNSIIEEVSITTLRVEANQVYRDFSQKHNPRKDVDWYPTLFKFNFISPIGKIINTSPIKK
jgi:hypothetical protein